MIQLSRLDGESFVLNAELIRYVERRPDTFITLTTGDRMVVAETMEEVMRRAIAYQRAKYLLPPLPAADGDPTATAMPPLASHATLGPSPGP